jgi:phage terminase large subunit GpA-like protein
MNQLLLSRASERRHKAFNYAGKIAPEDWAEQIYRLPAGGRFRWSYAPYTKGIFLSYFDRFVAEVVLMIYSRGLKSTTALLKIGYTIDQEPCRILNLWPTTSQAEKYCKEILVGELFDTTPPLNYLGTSNKKRSSSNTILSKSFPGGLFSAFGANSAGEMRRAKGQILYGEEIDAFEETKTDEGDQLGIFFKRGDEYKKNLKILASYPSLSLLDHEGNPMPGHSRIDARMRHTDGQQWWSHCVKCGDPLVMHRRMIRYDKDKTHLARMECPLCHEILDDSQRYEMAHRQGFDNWKPQHTFKGRRGYHANAMLWPHPVDEVKMPGGFLQMLAEQELAVERSDNKRRALRVLVNTVDAEPFDPRGEEEKTPDWKGIFARREEYTTHTIPKECLGVTGFADIQKNRIEIEWRGWGRNERSWGIEHIVVDGHVKEWEVWAGLANELKSRNQNLKREDGAQFNFRMFFIDGGAYGDYVLRFLQWLNAKPIEGVTGKVRATKGEGKHNHPIIDTNWKSVDKNLKGYHIGTWAAKDLINHRLKLKAPEKEGEEWPEGYMHYSKGYGETYFQQLCTGIVTIEYEGGEEIRKFLNESHLKDEGLDLAVGNLAAFRLRRWNFEAEEAKLLATIPQKEDAPSEPQERPMPKPANGFVGVSRWRI